MKTVLRTVVFFIMVQTANAQTFNSLLAEKLQDTLDYYVSVVSNIKGMSASVYLPGQGQWTGTAGLSYAGNPITPDMRFGIASNTKLFVATVMLNLQENNVLDLDDAISLYLPTYTNINPNITIRQLLNHTSGVSDPLFVAPYMDTIDNNATRVFTPTEVLGWVGAPTFAPGASWGYSNINYILAGMIAQNATGYHISQLIRDSILDPLNMDSTYYDVEETATGTLAHRWWNGIDYRDTSTVGVNTAGGCAGSLVSTASEMGQWYHGLFSGQILNQSSLDELSDFVSTTSSTYNYGLGIARETTLSRTYWGHGGSIWGYKSKMIYDTTCMGAVVCGLTNSFPAGMDGVTFLLYRILINNLPGCGSAISGATTVCQGQNSVTYTVPSVLHATSYTWTLPNGATGTSSTNTITVNYGLSAISGTITVKGVNAYGVGGTSSLAVTVNPKPSTPVITQNGNTLHSSVAVGNQWYDQNGIINGAINQDYTVTADGDYHVSVTLLGCTSENSTTQSVLLTGINEMKQSAKIYPNPVSNELIIEPIDTKTPLGFEISNSSGQVVFKSIVTGKTIVPVATLPAGIYFIKLSDGTAAEFSKLIKQ
jgi:D-alanyl-D-alanine carboxypeptidase